jgi:FSR family fosmidomycin resistance protein-like MFS transporter
VVTVLGIGHMVVDATTIYTATRIADLRTVNYEQAVAVIATYNFLAFATQALLGWIVDRLRAPAPAAALGAAFSVLAAVLWTTQPMLALVLAGIGNALFHVGAGSICLQLAQGRAAISGVFVGPGSVGVILGAFMGQGQWGGAWLLIAAAALVAAHATTLLAHCLPTATRAPGRKSADWSAALLLLLFVVAARSFTGGLLTGPWQTQHGLWIALGVAAAVAKILAGFAADRAGWVLIAGTCALLAAPLVIYGQSHPAGAVLGIILVQATMPVTLSATWCLMPDRPALAFGLASLALTLGTAPAEWGWPMPGALPLMLLQVSTAAALVAAIRTVLRQSRRTV